MVACTVYLYIATFGANIRFCRRQGGRWAAAFSVERAVMRPTGRRHSGNAGRGSRRRAATAKLDAQAEATDLVVVTSEGDLGTGQALARQGDELAHPGQRQPGRRRVAAPSPGGGATRGQGLAPRARLTKPRRLLVGAAVALVLSEDARKTVLDALFGAEEEFEYTSTTSINGG